jgi:DNA-binding winged helix-turn-helix (wHTH) protein/tetratricopeptide (TPR) repeat protein
MTAQNHVVYEFGPVRIDPSIRKLIHGDETVHIQARGFDALLLLIQRRNEVVSKGELLATIWPDTHVEESNLPVMISAIRRAIGDDGRNQKYIETVSKFGYRFVGEVTEICMAEPAAPVVRGLEFDDPATFSAEPAGLSPKTPEALTPRHHYARFSVMAGCVATALAALFLIYRVYSGAGESHVAAASRSPAGIGRPSTRADAEMWYRKGSYAWNLQTKDGFLRSIEYYQESITADPDYAPTYAGLAKSYLSLSSHTERPGDERHPGARAAAAKAVSLDDRLADAHIALGMVFLVDDQNFARAEREFRRAIALDSHSQLAEGELAFCLVAVGRTEEAVDHARRAKALDPLSIRAATDLGLVLYYGHRFTEAESELEEVLKLDPHYYRADTSLGKTYLSLGRFDDASRVFAEASLLSNHDAVADGLMAEAKGLGGDIAGAQSILAALEKRAQTTYVAPLGLAFATFGVGRLNDTLVDLRKAHDDRTNGAIFIKVDPNWEALHGNPDFRNLVSDIPPTATEYSLSDSNRPEFPELDLKRFLKGN